MIKTDIITELNNYFSFPVIEKDHPEEKPPYPYVGVKQTSVLIPDRHHANETEEVVASTNPSFTHDIERTSTTQDTTVFSISAYSTNEDEALTTIQGVFNWFRYAGYFFLRDKDLVVANLSTIQNRSSLMVDDYEHQVGFDATIRFTSEYKQRIDTIESVSINNKTYDI